MLEMKVWLIGKVSAGFVGCTVRKKVRKLYKCEKEVSRKGKVIQFGSFWRRKMVLKKRSKLISKVKYYTVVYLNVSYPMMKQTQRDCSLFI